MTKAESGALGLLLILGLIGLGISKIFETLGFAFPIVACAAVVVAVIWLNINQRKRRLEYLRNKYGNEEIVRMIVQRRFWQGQTSEQLTDSLGNPVSVDQKILKSKTREVWKYNRQGSNRYGLRITLDDGIVVGWDQKS
jgi:hypothetical protein